MTDPGIPEGAGADPSQESVAELRTILERDPVAAAALLKRGAEAGLPDAQARYGEKLLAGDGVAQDRHEALRWFITAAHADHPAAINMVGRCHEKGWGTAVDETVAARCYRRAAEAGLDWGMYNYAGALGQGIGVEKDERAAVAWFGRAAALGHAKSIGIVGALHEEGRLLPRDMAAAERGYRTAAQGGDFRSQFHLARLSVARGDTAAASWLQAAWAGAHDRYRAFMAEYLDTSADPGERALLRELSLEPSDPPVPLPEST